MSESVTKCDFCGIDKARADRLHDIFHLTGWPCLLCTTCMDREFGTTAQDALLALAHERLLLKLSEWGEEE